MLTFLSYLAVFWLGVCIGFFLRQLAAMAACIVFAVLMLSPAPAEALTKRECIHLGYGCQWSKATGGRVNGWYFTTGKKLAAAKSSKPNTDQSSTPMSAVADAVASVFDGTDRPSSTRGSRHEIGAHLREGVKRRAADKDTRRISQEAGGPARPSPVSTPRQVIAEAELRSLFPERLPAGCPQARINEAFAVMGMGR